MKKLFAAIVVGCAAGASLGQGPDVTLSGINSVSRFGPVGGVHGYAIGSNTCNMGNQNLLWTSNGTPGLAMNMYRLHNGRLQQIGLSWVKTACCAAAGSGCGLSCNGAGGSVLGAGCLDVYSSGWNGIQSRLKARSNINAWTGAFTGGVGASGSSIAGEINVAQADMTAATYPGALYFFEGVYAATDDAAAGNRNNNASHVRATLDASYNATATGGTIANIPAIRAMRDHANGLNNPDSSVVIGQADVPGEGRFWYGVRVRDLGGGMYRYDYNVFNLSSDRSGGSISIPMPAGAAVVNTGFSAPAYHSGEPYSNAAWVFSRNDDAITWSSPQTHAQNANSNALRWGTMYSFWFDCNISPANRNVVLGLFKPGTPTSMSLGLIPSPRCRADFNNSGGVADDADVAGFFNAWDEGDPSADFNGSGGVPDDADIVMFFREWNAGC